MFECDWRLPCLPWNPALTLTPALSQMVREKAVYASPGFRPRNGVRGRPTIGGMTNSVAGTIHPGSESGTCFRTKTGGGLASPAPLDSGLRRNDEVGSRNDEVGSRNDETRGRDGNRLSSYQRPCPVCGHWTGPGRLVRRVDELSARLGSAWNQRYVVPAADPCQ